MTEQKTTVLRYWKTGKIYTEKKEGVDSKVD